MPDSIQAGLPIIIEAWLGDSAKIEGTDEDMLPGTGNPIVDAAHSFNVAHPEYEVRIRKIDYRELPKAVAEAVAQGNPPALAEYVYTATQVALDTRARAGGPLFVPVERAVRDRTEILGEPVILDDIVASAREYWSRGGELVSVPTTVTCNVLFANRAILERAGIDRMPATWQDLEAACAAVAALPDGPAHGVTWPNYGWLFHREVVGQGGLFCNGDNGRAGRATRVFLDSPEMLAYVQWWKHMHDRAYYHYTGEVNDYFGAMVAFGRQDVAFAVTSSAVGQEMLDIATAAGFELLAGHLPRSGAEPYSSGPLGGQSFFLTAGLPTAVEDGALAFLQHQLNPQHAIARMHSRSLPLTQPAHEQATAEQWTEPFPGYLVATEQLASPNRTPAAAGPLLGNLNGINGIMIAAMDDVLKRGAEPAARFREASRAAQALLDRYNASALAYPPVTPEALTVTA
ncbi:extracellular solute-binding protein [Plantactinospora soyae]|uniref:Sn-glycerol 3-phosphate transport system substrate-binding protein n=1 Tax=Plantactinospora soyae TaxID=1544732 RepID=A0A927MA34_9ACTN|nr:extracellular solute-binding protein [Plantactinospora soyae]MBE1489755.1 sn-glycerol 3-phosphate transport system substrate-binding protein [Plantactinospora soyae]